MADPGQRIRSAGCTNPARLEVSTTSTHASRHGARPVLDGAGPLCPGREQDACGVGFIANQSGERSPEVLALALEALARVAHRGAASTDKSGDGAGILSQIPREFFEAESRSGRVPFRLENRFAVGMFFLPADAALRSGARDLIESVCRDSGLPVLGWRDVPVDPNALGPTARESSPRIQQLFLGRPAATLDDDDWERALYLARRDMELTAQRDRVAFYACSLSCRTIVYKAQLIGAQLPLFYPDLTDRRYETAMAVFHQRYATNTLPSWELAQPFRMVAHNGEINTLWGNRNAMTMRQPMLASPLFGAKVDRLRDVITPGGSDSASFDNALELLVRAGRSPTHAAMMLVPQAWERYSDLEPSVKAFYEYHQCLLEPWDGPAALSYSDGIMVGASLDRNGLRPCRYQVREDGLVVVGSEVGLVDFDPKEVIESAKVGPGEVLLVDTARRVILRSADAKREVAARKPYARWVARNMVTLAPLGGPAARKPEPDLHRAELVFGYGFEDRRLVIEPMATAGADPVWSMGDDTPIAPLSLQPQSLYAYFRQRFAQVTNPPIDSLREAMVMSLRMHLGSRGSPLVERASYARMLRIEHPVLLAGEMAALRQVPGFHAETLDATWPIAAGPEGLEHALDSLAAAAEAGARARVRLLVISDRNVSPGRAPVPMLLAVGAVRQHLVRQGLRARVGLVAEAGDAFDPHHIAALVGYGAEAVHPWLALETAATVGDGAAANPARFRDALEKSLLKVLSKMGISTLSSYCGAQIFEALGLGAEVIDRCFAGTVSPLGGLGWLELGADVLARHRAAFAPASAPDSLPDHGRIRFRKEGEDHGWSPPTVIGLQQALGAGKFATGGSTGAAGYQAFSATHHARRPASPRDLLGIRRGAAIPLDEVEPVEGIRARFLTSAMSLGALSPEAHATLSIAMNRIGARSNSGEGGEDPANYRPMPNGDRADNRIKQVASGRFGVTTEYLVRAEELEIKIVQGAKPGEGGQLPAHKVTDLIARLRHSVPGVSLISPPPHHDIYSIEDLAQLIHDLKTVNPRARVGVKLVAEAGVGTVAAGVAKAYADYVLIAGHNGGTGASPLTSIKHAGSPWELGLAETQRVLVRNRLRHRIEVRVDGGFKTGRDVVVGAMLGAESFGFGTAPLVAIGCAMARQCHMNSCPTGVASQRPELRAKFTGTPEQVVAHFTFVAEEVRALLASIGARSLDEVIGRADLLERVERPEVPRAALLDLGCVLDPAEPNGEPARRTAARNDRPGGESLDQRILADAASSIAQRIPFLGRYPIRNHHLTVGARIAGVIAEKYGDSGLPAGHMTLQFRGSAGQSFGAFAIRGMHLDLEGEANDYVGKGLNGAEITIRPFREAGYAYAPHKSLIVGNTVLYGATGGTLLAAGQAGDRFAVRNSGAVAVIEGAGDHCCEYMTGGIVAVLGRVGRNFGAGMSNGLAYVLDDAGDFSDRINPDMISAAELDDRDEMVLLRLMREHRDRTVSLRARRILAQWALYRPRFRKVVARGAEIHQTALREDYLLKYEPAVAVKEERLEVGPVAAA
ncbi:MAG: glutamate synthase large subunit [Gemmatimonadota bacterium]